MAGAGVLPRSGTGIAGGQLQCCLDLRGKWLQPFSELLAFQGANAFPWGGVGTTSWKDKVVRGRRICF